MTTANKCQLSNNFSQLLLHITLAYKNQHFLVRSYFSKMKVKVLVTQSRLILCIPIDCSLPVHWILQARILEWVAISFSMGSPQPRARTQVSHIAGRLFMD